jgi:hypothetical protein
VGTWEQIASTVLAVPQGLVPIVPTSVTNGSTTGDGRISFSAQTTITLNGIFSATYDNYLVQFVGVASTYAATMRMRFASSGIISTTDAWAYGGNSLNFSAIAFSSGSSSSTDGLVSPLSNNNATANFAKIEIASPFLASEKIIHAQNVGHTTQFSFWGSNSTMTSRDGLALFMSAGTFTGTIRVYGYSKGGLNQPQTITPYSMAAGNTTVTGTGATTASATVTFPTGRFSVAPIVTTSFTQGTIYISNANAITSTGFTMVLRDRNDGAISGAATTNWQAVQMLSSAASG